MERLIPSNFCHDSWPHLTSSCFPMTQVTTGGRASYYVSYRREAFAQIKLPKYSLPKVCTTCVPGPIRQSSGDRLPCWAVEVRSLPGRPLAFGLAYPCLSLSSVFSSQQGMQAGVLISCDSDIQHNLGSFLRGGSERSSNFGVSSEHLFLLQGPHCQVEGQAQNGPGRSTDALCVCAEGAQVSLLKFSLLSTFSC